jgi:hypothetical protein
MEEESFSEWDKVQDCVFCVAVKGRGELQRMA